MQIEIIDGIMTSEAIALFNAVFDTIGGFDDLESSEVEYSTEFLGDDLESAEFGDSGTYFGSEW